MGSQIEHILNIYRNLAKIPALAGARLLNQKNTVISKWTQRNLERKTWTKIAYHYILNDELLVGNEADVGVDISNELLSIHSPSETFKAIIKEQTESGDTKKQYLEIWQSRYLTRCIDLAALEIHGDVYADSEFGALEWSPNEEYVAYIAEKKITKSEPFYKRKPMKPKKEDSSETPVIGKEYEYRQDWGEQLVGKYSSVIVVCHLESESLTVLEGLPASWCPGQIKWAPDSKSLIGVAWETEPRRFGLIFCTNRPSVIFNVTLDGICSTISESNMAVRSPRFSPDYNQLVWLQRPINGPHHGTMQLVGTVWPVINKPSIQMIMDVISDHIPIENNEIFYGIYCQALPARAFSTDSKRLVFTTAQQNENRSYILNLSNLKLTDISDKSVPSSTTVLDVSGDIIVAARSSINNPHQLLVARLPKEGNEKSLVWLPIGSMTPVPQEVSNLEINYLDLKHENNDDSVNSFTAIFAGPTEKVNKKAVPLIVWPHGGPHGSFINSYSLDCAFFAMLGFSTLQINYRGSVGAGQKGVDFLPGRIGDADVKDCKLATDVAIDKFSIEKSAISLFGGSHGGFLVAHLSGQYPESYHAVSSRNPVNDASTMISSTDIPDWCAVECGQEYTEVGPIDESLFLSMRRSSPIVHAHKVRAPTVLMLGSNDKRVPFHQGIEYYHRLKANGCKVKMHIYPDNHSLSSTAVEMDNLINSALWFIEHTQTGAGDNK